MINSNNCLCNLILSLTSFRFDKFTFCNCIKVKRILLNSLDISDDILSLILGYSLVKDLLVSYLILALLRPLAFRDVKSAIWIVYTFSIKLIGNEFFESQIDKFPTAVFLKFIQENWWILIASSGTDIVIYNICSRQRHSIFFENLNGGPRWTRQKYRVSLFQILLCALKIVERKIPQWHKIKWWITYLAIGIYIHQRWF